MIDEEHPLLLGSASPRRAEILRALGLPVTTLAASIDESWLEHETPERYLERITAGKLAAVARIAPPSGFGALLVADTIVVKDGRAFGKPSDVGEAARMLEALSGSAHEVWTRFEVSAPGAPERRVHAETVRTKVVFRALRRDEVERYAQSGEGLDKAGAYAVQGIGAFAVARVEGSYSAVVGLPACEVIVALRDAGLLAPFPGAPNARRS